MESIPKEPPDEIAAAFEKQFERSFRRVYAYVFARAHDHATAQRLTRSVLTRALPELLEDSEPQLSVFLLRTANCLLHAETEKRAL